MTGVGYIVSTKDICNDFIANTDKLLNKQHTNGLVQSRIMAVLNRLNEIASLHLLTVGSAMEIQN